MEGTLRMREVLFVLPALHGGGAERVVLQLVAAALKDPAWSPVLVLTTRVQGAYADDVPDGVPVIRLGAGRSSGAAVTLLRLIRTRRPAIVFSTLDHLNIMLGFLRPLMPRDTCLVLRATSHQSLDLPGWRFLLPVAFRQAQGVVYQSGALAGAMAAVLRHPTAVGRVIPNPVDALMIKEKAALPLPADAPIWMRDRPQGSHILVASGRLVREKGLETLIAALAQLGDRRLHLAILGRGPLHATLADLIAQHRLTDRVALVGFRDNPWAWMARADAFVLSSVVEGFPNVVLEALVCGCPVIATPLPGLAGVAGCRLTADCTVGSMAEALAAFVAQPHRAVSDVVASAHAPQAVWQAYASFFAERLAEGHADAPCDRA